MYIHRSFFVQAMLDHPEDPLRSGYAPSFLAAYRSASAVIKAVLYHFERYPDLLLRMWSLWTNGERLESISCLSTLTKYISISCGCGWL